MKRAFLILLLNFPLLANAGIDTDMANFYTGLGGNVNVTPSGLYKSQAGGFYSGGGIYARSPIRSYNLLTVTPPSITAGCGGIDAYLGGFSFINAGGFTSMLRNIGNNSQGYIFNLALQTFAPQIYSLTQDLQSIIKDINSMSINSCEAAQSLVDGAIGVITQKSRKGCQSIAMARGLASDYKAAESYCNIPANLNSIYQTGTMSPAENEVQFSNKNLVWAGLNKNTYTGLDASVKELVMSLVGTFIVTTVGGTPKIAYKPPTTLKIKDLINGTKGIANAEVFSCASTDPECLTPTKKNIALKGYRFQAEQAITDIEVKLVQEKVQGVGVGGLLPSTLDLMAATDIPVMRSMVVAGALGPSVTNEFSNALVEPVAFGLVARYVSWGLNVAKSAVLASGLSAPEEVVTKMLAIIREKQKELADMKKESNNIQSAYKIIEKTIFYERVLMSNISPDLQAVFQYAKAHR